MDMSGGSAIIANSGDNSVSYLGVGPSTTGGPYVAGGVVTVSGIPAPYAVAICPDGDTAVVSSPSDGSVTVLAHLSGPIARKVQTGSQPYSVACYAGQAATQIGVVSNLGDSSLSVFNVSSGTVLATIPGVPGSRGYRGVVAYQDRSGRHLAWVAGTDSNAMTIVNLDLFSVLTQIPVSRPTAVRNVTSTIYVASGTGNSISRYDIDTFEAGGVAFSNVPNPQDFVLTTQTGIGHFATIGGQDGIWRMDSTGAGTVSTISGVPGAASLGAYRPGPNQAGVVLVTSTNSNSVYIIQVQPALPAQFGVSNGASFASGQAAPGTLTSAFLQTGTSQSFFASSLPLGTSLGGVSLRVGGTLTFNAATGYTYSPTGSIAAPLLFVGPTQVNFQIPPGIAVGSSVPMQLTKPDGSTLLSTVNIGATSPGIFTILQNGQGQGAVLNQDSSLNGDPQARVGAKAAARGSVIQIYATGQGATSPTVDAGVAAPTNPLALTVAQPTVTIGGKTAQVQFSGLAPGFVGLWQINAVVPADVTPGNAVSLTVAAGGQTSNTVTIAIQ